MSNRNLEGGKTLLIENGQLTIDNYLNDKIINYPLSIINFKKGFTLAEVLITLAVIGVVSAITIPVLMTNINMRINSERHANIALKITKAMEQMRAHGKLIKYESTDKFVDELQKYLKIQKRCSADNIAECWPTETITDAVGEEYNVADCKQRKNLLAGSDSEDNNVGLILSDGASVILTYNTNYEGKDIGEPITSTTNYPLPIGGGKYKIFAYTSGVTEAIDFVTDVNGKTGPNSETSNGKYHDIRQFRNARFIDTSGESCTGDYDRKTKKCIKYIGNNYASLNCYPKNSSKTYYSKYCGKGCPAEADNCGANDYWAGAQQACDEAGMRLPSLSELQSIYSEKADFPSIHSINEGYFWSLDEYRIDSLAHFVDFANGNKGDWYKCNRYYVICVGK